MITKKQERKNIKKFINSERCSKSVQLVLNHYVKVFGKKHCKLNPARRSLIKSALARHGYNNVVTAITAMSNDSWSGRANNDDIRYAIAVSKGIDFVEKWLSQEVESAPVAKAKKTKWETMADEAVKGWN